MKYLPLATWLPVSERRWGPGLLLFGVETPPPPPSPHAMYCLFPSAGKENLRVLGA